MFKVVLYDGSEELPNDDIFYVLTKNGPYMRKKLGLIDAMIPVKQISVLKELTPYAKINIPKIPTELFAQVTAFFRKVYDEYRSESMVLLFLDTKTNEYYVHVPYQKVSAGGITYHRGFVLDDHIMVCSIHSHANFGAFHSGTDHDDERSFDGLHITIGKLGDKLVEIACSIMVNGTRFKCNPCDYIEGIDEIETKEDDKENFYIVGQTKVKYHKSVQIHSGPKYVVETVDFDESWMDKVEGTKYTYVKEVQRGIVFDSDDELSEDYLLGHFFRNFHTYQGITPIEGKKEDNTPKEELSGPCKLCPFNKHKATTKIENTPITK